MKLNFFTGLFKKATKETNEAQTSSVAPTEKGDEKQSEALVERGKRKAKAKDFQGAVADFTKAIELEPTCISAYLERSKAKRELGDKVDADRDFDEGNRLFENLDNGLKANDEANAYYEADDYKNAIKSYNKAISLIPSLTSIYYHRGCCKQYLQDYTGAVEDFSKSIQANASNKADAYYQRSKIKSHKLNDNNGALEDLNKAIELNPDDADYYYSRAILLDDYDGLQDLNKAVEIDPTDANNYLSRSLKKRAVEDYEGSLEDLTKYIELNPTDSHLSISEAYSLRAGMRLLQNDLQGALKDHNKAVKVDKSNANAFLERGIVKDLLRDHIGAISDFNKAIELSPDLAEAYFYRGTTKQTIGLEDEGIMDVIKAKTLGYEE